MDEVRRFWRLDFDPFAAGAGGFVALASHVEAAARVVHAIASAEKRLQVRAAAGLGKTVVLDRALAEARSPHLRIARATASDPDRMLGDLAMALGARTPPSDDRAARWRRLVEAVRVCRLQGQGVVLAIDDRHALEGPGRHDLERLGAIDPHPQARVTVLEFGRDNRDDDDPEPWALKIRLAPLSRGEAGGYVARKLLAAGRAEPTFTPRSITRLHALGGGIPRGLDRLAGLALRAGAARGLEMIGPEVVEGVAQECILPKPA